MSSLKDLIIRLNLFLHFYRKLLFISIGLSLVLGFFRYPIEAILFIKIILLALFFLYQFFTSKDELLFYKNFKITSIALFTLSAVFDLLVSVLIFKLMKLLL